MKRYKIIKSILFILILIISLCLAALILCRNGYILLPGIETKSIEEMEPEEYEYCFVYVNKENNKTSKEMIYKTGEKLIYISGHEKNNKNFYKKISKNITEKDKHLLRLIEDDSENKIMNDTRSGIITLETSNWKLKKENKSMNITGDDEHMLNEIIKDIKE